MIKVTVSDDGTIHRAGKKPRPMHYSHTETIKSLTREDGLVVLEGLSAKEYDALRKYMRSHGWIHTGVKNTYRRLRPEDLVDM